MVALVVGDRVQETCTTTGTGTLSLLGAVTQFQSFAAVGVSTGNTISYSTQFTVADQSGANWETSIGVYTTSGSTLTRTTVLSSSNAGALVNFGAGTKSVFINYSATMSVSGGGGGTYPTIQPTLNLDFANTKQLDPRITFVRNSTATYYDGQTTAMAEQNLLLQSQEFDNSVAWGVVAGTLTANDTVAPDGTTTADSFTTNTGNARITNGTALAANSIVSGNTYTMSVYAKNVTGSGVFNMYCGNTVAGFSSNLTATSVWQRFSFTFTANSTGNNIRIAQVPTAGDLISFWGAQLEQRSSVTAYTPTTTAAITNYIPVLLSAPAGVARFDCDPITGKSLGLLIEESRVNSLDFSSSFATSGGVQNNWADTNITRTAAAFIAPDSTQVGIQFTASAANATVISTAAVGSSLARTFSVWLKRISGTGVINYTLDNGTTWIAQAITSTVTRYIFTTTTANQQVGFQIVTAGDSIGIWGAQLEAGSGSFATSYIPTVASTVTRAADQASMTGTNFSSWYNQSQGTVYAEYDTFGLATGYIFTISEGSGSVNYISLLKGVSGLTNRFVTVSTSVNQGNIDIGSISLNINYKVIGSYITNNNNFCVGGGTVANDSTVTLPPNINNAYFGTYFTQSMNGHIRKLSYYPVALSSSNLVALTS